MILDSIKCFEKYVGMNPLFPDVLGFLESHPLETLAPGKYYIKGEDLYVNIVDSAPKTRAEAPLESHQVYIDIQIPISSTEEHGYSPILNKDNVEYDAQKDISFHHDINCTTYISVCPGQFVVYFPHDGHAPAITDITLRKAIFKVKL